MAQRLRPLNKEPRFPESTRLSTACNSGSRGGIALFWPLQALHTYCVQIHAGKNIQISNIFEKSQKIIFKNIIDFNRVIVNLMKI